MMKRKMLIFGDAYGSLNYLLYFVHENLSNYIEINIVLFNSDNYECLLNIMNKKFWDGKVIIHNIPGYIPSDARPKVWGMLIDLFKEKKYLKRIFQQYFSNIKGFDIYFTLRKHKYYIFHFIANLSVANSIYLSDADITTNNKKQIPSSPKDAFFYIRALLLYNRFLLYKKEASSEYIQISDMYIKNYNITVIDRVSVIANIDKCFKYYLDKFKFKYKVVFFDQGIENEGELNPERKAKFISKVFQIILANYSKNQIGIKFHPTQISKKEWLLNYGELIDDYFPGEFILSSSIDTVISGYSNVLKTNPHKTSVSLLHLLNFSEERTNYLENYLKDGSCEPIYLPNSFAQFEEILINLKK